MPSRRTSWDAWDRMTTSSSALTNRADSIPCTPSTRWSCQKTANTCISRLHCPKNKSFRHSTRHIRSAIPLPKTGSVCACRDSCPSLCTRPTTAYSRRPWTMPTYRIKWIISRCWHGAWLHNITRTNSKQKQRKALSSPKGSNGKWLYIAVSVRVASSRPCLFLGIFVFCGYFFILCFCM